MIFNNICFLLTYVLPAIQRFLIVYCMVYISISLIIYRGLLVLLGSYIIVDVLQAYM